MRKKRNQGIRQLLLLCATLLFLTGCAGNFVMHLPQYNGEGGYGTVFEETEENGSNFAEIITIENIPQYAGEPFVVLNENIPTFSAEEKSAGVFEYYSELDELGRCGMVYANVGLELMPTEERESIGRVKPSGWQFVKYDFVDGNYLYNRCHLIGFQLTGENANEQNLITGTRYMNVTGMLPFENQVAEYVKETGNHVLYRVTPMYEGANLVASGVQIEALSVEDEGEGVSFYVYVYNHQPGVVIDYATGESRLATEEEVLALEYAGMDMGNVGYVLNLNSMKFHYPYCTAVSEMKEKNKLETRMPREMLLIYGCEPCKICEP